MPRIINFPNFIDERGNLTVYDKIEGGERIGIGRGVNVEWYSNPKDLPFTPKRVFWIWGVPKGEERANHAHEICEQIIIPLAGGFVIEVDDDNRYYIRAHTGLYVETGHKIRLYDFSKGAICLVLCSEYYDESEVVE